MFRALDFAAAKPGKAGRGGCACPWLRLRQESPFILLVVLLLIGKVVSDLTLPLYTSRIVNIGIQQGGLEHTVPSALGEATFKALSSIADESTRSILEASYRFEPDTHAIAA